MQIRKSCTLSFLTFSPPHLLGFASNMHRTGPATQFGLQQSGPPMSPHPSPGGPVHHSMGSYQQGGPGYGPQGGQYGPSGNTPVSSSLQILFSGFCPKNSGCPLKHRQHSPQDQKKTKHTSAVLSPRNRTGK